MEIEKYYVGMITMSGWAYALAYAALAALKFTKQGNTREAIHFIIAAVFLFSIPLLYSVISAEMEYKLLIFACLMTFGVVYPWLALMAIDKIKQGLIGLCCTIIPQAMLLESIKQWFP